MLNPIPPTKLCSRICKPESVSIFLPSLSVI